MAARRALLDRGSLRRASALGLTAIAGARLLAAATAVGIAWAVVASSVHLAVFRGLLPSYDQLAFPLALALVVVDLPLLVGLYVETALGRASIAFAEVIAASLVSGVLLAIGLTALLIRARRAIR